MERLSHVQPGSALTAVPYEDPSKWRFSLYLPVKPLQLAVCLEVSHASFVKNYKTISGSKRPSAKFSTMSYLEDKKKDLASKMVTVSL